MRLIGTFETEKEAYDFYSFLLKEGVQNIYEPGSDEGKKNYRIWVYDENDLEVAVDWMKRYKENPRDPQFQNAGVPVAGAPPPPKYAQISEAEDLKWRSVPPSRIKRHRLSVTLTHLIIVLCGFLFLWNNFEKAKVLSESGQVGFEISLTPLMQTLLFDYPAPYKYREEVVNNFPLNTYKDQKDLPPEAVALLKQSDESPSWRGVYEYFAHQKGQSVPLFEKIREGEVWRLFTPCLLHGDFLHILFNMVWVWILCKQIEVRMNKWKMCLFILIIGIVSNIAQYLISGPYFLGFSGVVVGMAGFIWVRQKIAPWEGYPLQKSTALFLLLFVLAMFGLEVVMFILQMLSVIKITPNIANTAHIVGGLAGMLLGKLSFFGRRMS